MWSRTPAQGQAALTPIVRVLRAVFTDIYCTPTTDLVNQRAHHVGVGANVSANEYAVRWSTIDRMHHLGSRRPDGNNIEAHWNTEVGGHISTASRALVLVRIGRAEVVGAGGLAVHKAHTFAQAELVDRRCGAREADFFHGARGDVKACVAARVPAIDFIIDDGGAVVFVFGDADLPHALYVLHLWRVHCLLQLLKKALDGGGRYVPTHRQGDVSPQHMLRKTARKDKSKATFR